MKVRVLMFAPFRDLYDTGERVVVLDGGRTMRDLLEALCGSNARLKMLFNSLGRLNPYVTILKNGTSIKALDGMRTVLDEGDEIALLPPFAGG